MRQRTKRDCRVGPGGSGAPNTTTLRRGYSHVGPRTLEDALAQKQAQVPVPAPSVGRSDA
ncbi:MAG: hypothetical protein R2720_04015 [Candidatus Nanopelagicales bacterium]